MHHLHRRDFLGSSLGGLAAALSIGTPLWAKDAKDSAGDRNGKPAKDAQGSAPDTLFLTWQADPTSTITVQWVGRDSSDSNSIEYATLEKPVWQVAKTILKPFPNTDLKVHRCELTGLKPGTEYQFHVGAGSQALRFRTMPAKATDVIQFVSGGDCGTGHHSVETSLVAARQEPRFALIGGDLAYDNGRSPETFVKFLQNYHRYMVDSSGRLIPMVSCIGNHEVNSRIGHGRAEAPQYLSMFDGLFPEKTFGVLDVGDYLSLVLLDTGHIEPMGGEQTDWLSKTLSERQDRPHVIVANHVPAYPSYRAPETKDGRPGAGAEQRRHWSPLFERYNVDVVLEHHDHTFKRTFPLTDGMKDKYGVVYLGDGSWGKLRAPKSPEERPYLARSSQAYHITVHRLEGDQRFHVALESSGKVADVCTTSGKRPAKRG